jgi:hypothetical protein
VLANVSTKAKSPFPGVRVDCPRPVVLNAAHRSGLVAAIACLTLMFSGREAQSQSIDTLPFTVGERLEYRVKLSRFPASGRSRMTVEGPDTVRGQEALLLRFDFSVGFGFIKAMDRTESWLEPSRLVALRFQKRERHPLWSGDEAVELYPDEQRWEGMGGASGETATAVPLDELSFIYFLRTLRLVADSLYEFDRHYAADRNPITVKMVGRDTTTTSLGELATIEVELRVRDPRRYGDGVGLIRIHFTDDAGRVPVRIESEIPVVGKAVMTLSAWNRPTSGKP